MRDKIQCCPFCGSRDIEQVRVFSCYCPHCQAVIYISAEMTSVESPMLNDDDDQE